jgi:hypothetical protein
MRVVRILTTRTLDEVLSSRTHVRVLRVLVALDRRINLTARDLARRATASHAAIYCLAEEHPLVGAVRSLFDQERRTGEDNVKDPPLT